MERQRHGLEPARPSHHQGWLRLPHHRHRHPVVLRRRRRLQRSTAATPRHANVNGVWRQPVGQRLASFLLGYPSGDPGNLSRILVSEPANYFTRYYGAYLQDDFRVGPKLTVNGGIRIEHEDGLREEKDRFTVAFDRTLNPGGALGSTIVNGNPVRGGLVYAGVNGAPTQQGNQPAVKFSPRIGVVYSVNPKTVIRTGYGVYWAPWNYQFVGATNYGQIGYSQDTFLTSRASSSPTTTLTNPFPGGVTQPRGNSLGALEGVGNPGGIEFIDQDKKAPYVQQYSFDVNRELPGGVAIGFEYAGATGGNLGLGGSNDGVLNINQLDPSLPRARLRADSSRCPTRSSATRPARGLPSPARPSRAPVSSAPFPQFGNILMRQNTGGRNQYHAAILKFEKRVTNGWGGRINYTWSRLEDNQFGEGNSYSDTNGNAQNAYDLDAEYALSLLDVPHKLVFSPIVELPFGEGKRWAQSGVGNVLLGGWTLSSIVAFESGFPIAVSNNSNNLSSAFFRMQRPNLSGDPATSGSREDRFYFNGNPGVWLDSAAFSNPGAFVLGTAPRTLDNARTPHRNNWDFVASKEVKLVGKARGQIRIEVLNVTNTVKTRGPNSVFGSSSFGRVTSQRGFMRLTQLMFRMSF